MTSTRRTPLLTLLLGAAALAAAAAASLRLSSQAAVRPYDVAHVPNGAVARVASLGHRNLVSDLYWLALVQYVGDPFADRRGYEKLLPLADLVTDLDPRHGYAYQTAGIVLSAAGRIEESNRILRKGIERGPRWWTFPFYLSFNHWFYGGDFAEGARWAEVAARTPGASPNISHLALSLKSKAGSPEDALRMLDELRATVADEALARRLDEQRRLAVLERDAQLLERAAAEYEARRGAPIGSLDDLVRSGLLDRLPPDPFGGRYEWRADERRVRSSANPFRFSLREGPQRPHFQYRTPEVR